MRKIQRMRGCSQEKRFVQSLMGVGACLFVLAGSTSARAQEVGVSDRESTRNTPASSSQPGMPDAPSASVKAPAGESLLRSQGAAPTLEPAKVPLIQTDKLLACGCGCNIFDVGAQDFNFLSNVPKRTSGLSVWLRYSYGDQNQNYEHSHRASAADNDDKEIRTNFIYVGAQYNFNKDWSAMLDVPFFDRKFNSTDDGTVFGAAGSPYTAHLDSLGDIKVMATYHGFSSNESTGIQFGFQLPTGNSYGPSGPLGGSEFDRDSLPGTGSTNFLLGGYHFGSITSDKKLGYFVQADYNVAFLCRDNYRPGNEVTGAAGLSYSASSPGAAVKFTPILQLIGQNRMHDTGINADPLNSGYTRLFIAPGLQVSVKNFRVYGDVELPIYSYYNAASSTANGPSGQLLAPVLFKLQVGYDF
jgi:hypothetical protein